jgi:hypothetical protein
MPDMKQQHGSRPSDESILSEAVQLIADDDRATDVPAHLETAVMAAWDIRAGRAARRSRLGARRIGIAALAPAACAVLAAALWVQRADNGLAAGRAPAALGGITSTDVADSLDSIATTGVLLEEDRASMQLVRLSVQASVLAAFGYPLANPTDTEPLDVEVLIGLDGVPRAIRPVDNSGTWSTR